MNIQNKQSLGNTFRENVLQCGRYLVYVFAADRLGLRAKQSRSAHVTAPLPSRFRVQTHCFFVPQGHFYYAAKAFDVLERLDPNPEYWDGKRGACIGAFQMVIAGKEQREVRGAPCTQLPEFCTQLAVARNMAAARGL